MSLLNGTMVRDTCALCPILLGEGIRLFDHLGGQIELERIDELATAGVTSLRFRVVKG